ncbi:hypothetical protein HYQ46_007380 [Verticillium longisporum]|nr:hypothetical protein HYQ46_007380 [Verticillium longisporum]
MDVDDSEILLQSVAQELATEIDQHPQLLVGHLQRYEIVFRQAWVEVHLGNAREGGQIIDNGLPNQDIIIDERALLPPLLLRE